MVGLAKARPNDIILAVVQELNYEHIKILYTDAIKFECF